MSGKVIFMVGPPNNFVGQVLLFPMLKIRILTLEEPQPPSPPAPPPRFLLPHAFYILNQQVILKVFLASGAQ